MEQCFMCLLFPLWNRVSSVCKGATKSHQCRDGKSGGYPLSGTRLVVFSFLSANAFAKEQESMRKIKRTKGSQWHGKKNKSSPSSAGTPQPDIVWYKDAVPISPVKIPRYRVLVGGSLQINGLLPDDTGMFQCFARNLAGEIQTNTYLAVTSMSSWKFSKAMCTSAA